MPTEYPVVDRCADNQIEIINRRATFSQICFEYAECIHYGRGYIDQWEDLLESVYLGQKDAGTHNQETQYELRKQVVRLRKKGFGNKPVAQMVGISAIHCSTIWQKYLKGGMEPIRPGVRGRRHGDKRRLTAEQEEAVQIMLIDKAPNQLKLPFALWTREAVWLSRKISGWFCPCEPSLII